MSFGGSFWSILNFSHQSSQIDELLTRPDTTVEQLLEDDNILSEFKSMNPRLLEYQTDERIKQLLSYLIEEPPENADHNRGYKFPFVACEVLTADIQTFLSAFFGKNPNNIKSKDQNDQESSGEFEDYQNNPAENTEEDAEKKPAQAEGEEKAEEVEEAGEKAGKPETEANEESEPKTEKTETEENKENKPEGENEEPTEKRMSITIRPPPKDDQSEKSEENSQGTFELASYFFSFLGQDKLNVTLVGYFARFLNHIILRRGIETATYVWSNPNIIDSFIKHVEYGNLAECLAKLFCLEGLPTTLTNDFLDIRLEKLNKLIQVYSEDADKLNSEAIANTCFIICEIISKRSNALRGADLLNYFFSKEFLEVFFANLFRHNTLTTYLSTILNSLLQVVLQKKNSTDSEETPAEGDEETEKSPTSNTENFNEKLFLEYVAGSIGEMVEYLEKESETQINTTYGQAHKPFGIGKLRILESVLYMVKLNVHKVSFELGLKKIFQVLMGLLLAFEWNNMLHNQIEKIFVSTLESDSHVLKQKLLNQADLVGFLGRATQETVYKMPNTHHRKMRKGYLGHITRIGKVIEKLAEKDNDIKGYLEGDKWTDFNTAYLKPSIKSENHDLAGFTKKPSEDFVDDNVHIGNNLDDALGGKFEGFYGFDTIKPSEDTDNNFDKDFKGFDAWGESSNTDTGMTSSWPAGFDTQGFNFTFGESAMQQNEEKPENAYLELNKEVKIVDLDAPKEEVLQQEFIENQYWAKPIRSDAIDDILKEFEQI